MEKMQESRKNAKISLRELSAVLDIPLDRLLQIERGNVKGTEEEKTKINEKISELINELKLVVKKLKKKKKKK